MNKYENNKEFIRTFTTYTVHPKTDLISSDKTVSFLIYKKSHWQQIPPTLKLYNVF